jgi:hypothetical protein
LGIGFAYAVEGLSHLHTEHGDGIHLPASLVFKDLKATWSARIAGRGRGRGRGFGQGQGRGQHDEYYGDYKGSQYNYDDGLAEEEDPMTVDLNQKHLLGEQQTALNAKPVGSQIVPLVNALVNQFEVDNPNTLVPPSPPLIRDPKRKKHGPNNADDGKEKSNANILNSVGSQVERRPDQ